MDLEIIQKLIKIVNESKLEELKIEDGDFKIKLKNGAQGCQAVPTTAMPMAMHAAAHAVPVEIAPVEEAGEFVVSPLVGVFRGLDVNKKTAINVGDVVEKGQSVCIIEAMKLMNEIESDFAGEVAEIYVKDGDIVEFGQKLFRIKG